ncbi:MAG: hypothetical protein HY563_05415, partial [Ignavibacteriales bacterium]|nr:hypothetical protein [Ignavibacteriales bacterium]
GIGTFRYGGTTSILSARMDAVANITPIDYFAVAVTARSSRNDVTSARVPYLPGFEFSALYRRTFAAFKVTVSVNAFTERRASRVGPLTAPGGLWSGVRMEYGGIPRLKVFLNLENVLDRSDQLWRGYDVEPLRIDLGFSYRW